MNRDLQIFETMSVPLVPWDDIDETEDLEKFDPNQPRIPKGYGRLSGRWVDKSAAVLPESFDPKVIPRDPSLPREFQEIETRFAEYLANNPREAWKKYQSLMGTMGGKILSVDSARELSEDYLKDRTLSPAVHEPASWFMKEAFAARLREAPTEKERPEVLLMAGGPGVGKTTSILSSNPQTLNLSQIIVDSNLSKLAPAEARITQALNAGKTVSVVYVDRDPGASFKGVLDRAIVTGRVVVAKEYIAMHEGVRDVIPKLAERFQGTVSFAYIDNNGSIDAVHKVQSFADLPKIRYNSLRKDIYEQLDKAHREGRISNKVYRRTLGSP